MYSSCPYRVTRLSRLAPSFWVPLTYCTSPAKVCSSREPSGIPSSSLDSTPNWLQINGPRLFQQAAFLFQ